MDDQNTGAPRVSRYETGKHEPDQQTMTQIAEALGLPVAYFHAVDDILAEVILLVAKMPKAEREEVLALLRKRSTKGELRIRSGPPRTGSATRDLGSG